MPQVRAVEKGRAVITNRARLQLAFDLAEQHLGIYKLLDAEDIDVADPDERSVMTYVCQFMQKKTPVHAAAGSSLPPTHISHEEESLKLWLDSVLRTGIRSTQISQLESEYARHKVTFDRFQGKWSQDTIRDWNLIENEVGYME